MNQIYMIKKLLSNVLKSELVRKGLTVPGKKEELFKRLTNAIQKDNSDKQLSISLVKEISLKMSKEQDIKTWKILKKHKCYANNQWQYI